MKHLTEKKLQEITENYINGNITDARNQIRKLNKLELLQFVNRSDSYGLERHNAYTLASNTLKD